ncbi:hypothetical protein Trydic_g19679 [Trypoxylus dichotomus]
MNKCYANQEENCRKRKRQDQESSINDEHPQTNTIPSEGCHGVEVSTRTVRIRLVSAGLRARKLAEVQKWAKKYAHWSADDWSKIFWSDESNIESV